MIRMRYFMAAAWRCHPQPVAHNDRAGVDVALSGTPLTGLDYARARDIKNTLHGAGARSIQGYLPLLTLDVPRARVVKARR